MLMQTYNYILVCNGLYAHHCLYASLPIWPQVIQKDPERYVDEFCRTECGKFWRGAPGPVRATGASSARGPGQHLVGSLAKHCGCECREITGWCKHLDYPNPFDFNVISL